MTPKVERADPPYVQIARRIREDIELGVLAEGAMIPSAREISATWGVALATATKVHARLRSEGLIEAVPGVGTIVAGRRSIADGRQRLVSAQSRGLIYGGGGDHAVIRSSTVCAGPRGHSRRSSSRRRSPGDPTRATYCAPDSTAHALSQLVAGGPRSPGARAVDHEPYPAGLIQLSGKSDGAHGEHRPGTGERRYGYRGSSSGTRSETRRSRALNTDLVLRRGRNADRVRRRRPPRGRMALARVRHRVSPNKGLR